jgi:hypothetical protein
VQIITHKTDAMRKVQLLVSRGYSRYVSGEIDRRKAKALYLKFLDRYEVERSHQQRYRMKLAGVANSHLVMWLNPESKKVHWWLLATAGEGLVTDVENLKDATAKKSRIELTGYELLKAPRKDLPAAWTWQMTSENYKAWQERIRAAVRHKSDDLIRQALYSLKRVPRFSQSRKQAFALVSLMKKEWKRTQKGELPYPGIFIGFYGKYKRAETIPAELLTKKKQKAQTGRGRTPA